MLFRSEEASGVPITGEGLEVSSDEVIVAEVGLEHKSSRLLFRRIWPERKGIRVDVAN